MLTDAIKQAIRDTYARVKDGLPDFRVRPAQLKMIAEVARTLAEEGGAAAIEAPTGTGKSMAYLIAGHAVARAQHKRLLIATATVALQEQLVERDIPRYLKLSGHVAKIALAKGTGRYLCVRNLRMATSSLDAPPQLGLGLGDDLALWNRPPSERDQHALKTLTQAFDDRQWHGDMDRPPITVGESLRPLLTTSSGGCTGRRCVYFSACPLMAARESVDKADIVVANQDLVLSDLAMTSGQDSYGGVILPKPADTLYVFDEAHHVPAKTLDRGASEVHLAAAARALLRLGRQVHAAYGIADKTRIGKLGLEEGDAKLQTLSDALESLEQHIRLDWLPDPNENPPRFRGPLGALPASWVVLAEHLHADTLEVQRWLTAVRRAVSEATNAGPPQESLSRELGMALERIDAQTDTWRIWSRADEEQAPPFARWVSLRDGQLICHASAVSAADMLRKVLWDNASAVVMTSATLSAGGRFHEFADASGLPDDALTLALPSPFDLHNQAELLVPELPAMPEAFESHARAICDWLSHELDWHAGNLVLFTSRAKLDRVLQLLPLDQVKKVRAQGSQSKLELLAGHARAIEAGHGSTLFGLASFGEGLDLPGKLCTTVVITQLPFSVPTDPVGATYAEWLTAHGRNPFMEVSVPAATRLLIQYCGRLIRSEQDRGRIVLLDRRLVTKRYGATMLRSLPPFRRRIEVATPG